MLPATENFTTKANGRVTLRIESGADSTPLSVPGLLSKAAEECGDLTALNYKLENKWVKVTYKYDYSRNYYFINNCIYSFCFLFIENMNIMYELLLKLLLSWVLKDIMVFV